MWYAQSAVAYACVMHAEQQFFARITSVGIVFAMPTHRIIFRHEP